MNPATLRALLAGERRRADAEFCIDCPERSLDRIDPVVLVVGSRPSRCYWHSELAAGRSGLQLHHMGGKPSPLTLLVNANTHRRLSLLQDLTWRAAGIEPGSPEAILIDSLALVALGDAGGVAA